MLSIFFKLCYLLIWLVAISADDSYPSCGNCWCIPPYDGTGPCPVWQPQNNFSTSVIATYKAQQPSFYYSLSCNPYEDANCYTTPPQTMLEVDEAVCAYKYQTEADGSISCVTYEMITYKSRRDAEEDGAVLTHGGSCGLCSTTQDLAIYLSKYWRFSTVLRVRLLIICFNNSGRLHSSWESMCH
jgi:hypothetical protein